MSAKVKWIYLAAFLDLFAVSLILPSMAAHLKSLGASYFMIGMMTSIYASTQLLSGPIIGSWSDKIGRQKLFVITYLIVGCCYPLIGFINSFYIILLLRATIGIFKHGQVLIRTIVTDQIPIDNQSLLFGHLKSIAGVSFTLGPAIGGHLSELDKGFSYVACCTGFLLILNSVIGYLYLDDVQDENAASKQYKDECKKKPKSLREEISEAIRSLAEVNWRLFGQVFTLKFILDMSAGVYHSNYSIKIQERFSITPKISGYTIAFQSFVGVITGLFVAKINDKLYKTDVDYKKRNIHGFILMAIGYLGIYFATSLSVFLLWTVVLKTSHMFMRIILTDMLMRKCPSSQTGSIAGTSNSVSNFARLITPIIAGIFEDTWGTNSANFLAAVIASIGILVSLNIKNNHSKTQ
ncbi:major facilitator superfamily domain-containing protein 9-like [Microplitis mediator]|uniref:major facilitator superfamily domain-containing protein 9-like n=1 Tax=Microplitis mediator TaxID=375433 RepID=UPI002552DA31|nr:major facilitator superfamily domain-containing protein 9-like [Microplitis mediator]